MVARKSKAQDAVVGLLELLIKINALPAVIKDDFAIFAAKFPNMEPPAELAWQWFNNRWSNVNIQMLAMAALAELAATVKAGGGPVVHDDVDIA